MLFQKLFHSKISVSDSFVNMGYISNGVENSLPALFGVGSVSADRIVDYIVYQIYCYRNIVEEGRWRLDWLFSDKAIKKYKAQFLEEGGKTGVNYYINLWLKEAGLTRESLVSMIEKKEPQLKTMVYMMNEEPIKMRFHNTEDGLLFCQSNTTGWSPLSDACAACNNVEECEIMTEQKFPELMRYRKEIQDVYKKK